MRICGFSTCDLANGFGARVSLFVSGCSLHCHNCFQPESWDFDYGEPFDEKFKERVFKALSDPYIDGLSVLGGDPLEEKNVEEVTKLLEEVREKFPNKTIWLWTGRNKEKVVEKYPRIIELCDVIKSGAYVDKLKCNGKYFGSSNQEIWWCKTLEPYDDKDTINAHAEKDIVVQKRRVCDKKMDCCG